MKRGAWHQFGDRSQKLVLEQLEHGAGVGIIISPRDLTLTKAQEYANDYKDNGAEILVDPQFHVPEFTNKKLATYPGDDVRASITKLNKITPAEFATLVDALKEICTEAKADGVIAPAVVYEAGRPDILDLNDKLFAAARQAGNDLGLPTYATVILGRTLVGSDSERSTALSHVTGLKADGFYYAYEFDSDRIPVDADDVFRCGAAALTLACTGKPVLHAYAGPMALLSAAFGASSAGIGHSQNLWQFSRARFAPPTPGGGGGDAPPRFFSTPLWGTIVCPDELELLGAPLRAAVMQTNPFSAVLASVPTPSLTTWSRWDANKHLVHALVTETTRIFSTSTDARACLKLADDHLKAALSLHDRIEGASLGLKDESLPLYQANWRSALARLKKDHVGDYDLLDLLA